MFRVYHCAYLCMSIYMCIFSSMFVLYRLAPSTTDSFDFSAIRLSGNLHQLLDCKCCSVPINWNRNIIRKNHHCVSKKATWCIIAKMHHFFIKIFSKKIPIVFCGQARPTAARHTPIHLYGRRDTLKMYQSWICVSDITFMYMYLLQRSLNVSKSCITYRSFHVLF